VGLIACETSEGEGPSAQISAREDNWCVGSDKKVAAGGYCTCRGASTRYDESNDQCVACTAACDGRACGDDGCQGSCGTCDSGQACVDGACMTCEASCDGKRCGEDDGCGGRCGGCDAPETDADTVTACNCNPPPVGAYPGAVRFEGRCASGFVQFGTCEATCATGEPQWAERCIDGLPCGAYLVGCNCGFIQAFPGMAVPAASCAAKVAYIQQCPVWCGGGPAWAAVCGC
jgi:hypothetical protein